MEIEIENTKEDFVQFYKYYIFKRTIHVRIYIALVVGFVVFGGKYSERKIEAGQSENILQVLIVGVIVFTAITIIPYFISMRRLTSMIGTSKSPEGKKKFITTDKGFEVVSATGNVFYNWEYLKDVNANEQFIYLHLLPKGFYILPSRYFNSEKDISSFLSIAQSNVVRIRNQKPLKRAKKASELYWWGFLGLIPFIGAIIGLFLLARGIFQYKDKFLILIGMSCILFTVAFFTYLSYSVDPLDEAELTYVSKMQLNGLMKEVEFYKIQNGVYPDSLEEIKKDSGMSWIEDALQERNGNKININYNYKKVGDKYYLFSSGIDGKPNTADDFYPTIKSSDSSKFGLLRN